MKHKVYCNGESLYIDGEYVVDCCESLEYTFEKIASALDADYEYRDQLED
ncbi:MAG: hypothetical protein RR942_01235 [Romboutsia sp.]